MIIIKDVRESLLEQEIPGTLNALRAISPQLESMGFDIEIRDTYHTFDSLRIYPMSRGEFNEIIYKEADSILNETINNSCSQCGTNKDINQYPYDAKNDWSIRNTLCNDCYQKSQPFIPPIPQNYLKDCTGKYVKDGDILMGINTQGAIFWGLVLNKPSNWGNNYEGPNPEWGQFMLIHGFTSFPSSLAWAKKFIIIDNCGTDHNPYDDYNKHSYKYEQWLNKIDNPPKWWFWKRKEFDFEKFKDILKHHESDEP